MSSSGLDRARLARTLTLIVFVTAVSLFVLAERLDGTLFRIGVAAIGAIAVITAITGFLIAVESAFEEDSSNGG